MMIALPHSNHEIVGVILEHGISPFIAGELVAALRAQHIPADYLYGGSSRKQLDKLRKRGITAALFVRPVEEPGGFARVNVQLIRRMGHDTVWRIAKALAQKYDVTDDHLIRSEVKSDEVSDLLLSYRPS
jgi:hypothetical protein